MNLCDFCCSYLQEQKACLKRRKFVRPTGQRVFCCTDFEQYPLSYADVVYTDFEYPSMIHVIGCIGSKPSKKERKKNQVQFNL